MSNATRWNITLRRPIQRSWERAFGLDFSNESWKPSLEDFGKRVCQYSARVVEKIILCSLKEYRCVDWLGISKYVLLWSLHQKCGLVFSLHSSRLGEF